MSETIYECMDAGTENCPCYLAVTGDCLTCSRLQGKDACDCNWRGVCIYNEFMQGNGQINNPRTEFLAPIVSVTSYLDDLMVYVLDVGRGFAIKAGKPGSFVFLRNQKENRFYDLPISVMYADVEKGYIHVAVKVIALKTKSLIEEKEGFVLRGVYRNGILGLKPLLERGKKKGRILLITKGVGIAPAILMWNTLQHHGKVEFMIDTDKISGEMIQDYLGEQQASLSQVMLSDEKEVETLALRLKEQQYDGVAVLTSDHFIGILCPMIKEILPHAAIASSNNYRLCCGEGICGSCIALDERGKELKMCKCQNLHF